MRGTTLLACASLAAAAGCTASFDVLVDGDGRFPVPHVSPIGTDTPTPTPTVTATPPDESLAGNGFATGHYLGDGTSGRPIDAGVVSAVVLVVRESSATNDADTYIAMSSMGNGSSKRLLQSAALVSGTISSLGAGTSFQVSGPVNQVGEVFHWVAFAETAQLVCASYMGDGDSSTRTIDAAGVTYTTEVAVVVSAGPEDTVVRDVSFGAGDAQRFGLGGPRPDEIKTLSAMGDFGVGPQSNLAGETYHYASIGENASLFTGTYPGAGAPQIINATFKPEVVLIQTISGATHPTTLRTVFMPGADSLSLDGVTHPDAIVSLESSSFQIGSDDSVNEDTVNYWFLALDLE